MISSVGNDNVTVRIGHEGPLQELSATSVVASGYGPGSDALAALGIVGPTRMDYPGTMAAVRADMNVIFGMPPEARYDAAMQALGVSAANLSEEAGHA